MARTHCSFPLVAAAVLAAAAAADDTPPRPPAVAPRFFDPPPANPYADEQRERAVVYNVSELLDALAKQHQVDLQTAKQLVAYELRRNLQGTPPVLRWSGDKLVAVAGEPGHHRHAARLDALRTQLFDELQINVCLAEAPSQLVSQLPLDWQVSPPEPRPDDARLPLDTATGLLERRQALKWAVLDPQQSRQIERQLTASHNLRILGRPAVRVFSGRQAVVEANRQRPFVVEVNDNTPRIATFNNGWKLELLPEARQQQVLLRGRLVVSHVQGVETVETAAQRIQIPEVERRQLQWMTQLPLNATLIVSGLRQKAPQARPAGPQGDGQEEADDENAAGAEPSYQETLVLMRLSRISSEQSAVRLSAHHQPAGDGSPPQPAPPAPAASSPQPSADPPPAIEDAWRKGRTDMARAAANATAWETRVYEVRDLVPEAGPAVQSQRLQEIANILSLSLETGGQHAGGGIELNDRAAALRVRQTAAGHRQVAQLLDRLRALLAK